MNEITRAKSPSGYPDRLMICSLQVETYDWISYITMWKMRSKDKYCLKWVGIRQVPKGMVYSGGINAINRTKPPKTKRHTWSTTPQADGITLPCHRDSRVHTNVCKIKPNNDTRRFFIPKLKSRFTFHWSPKALCNAEAIKCPSGVWHKQERRPPGVEDSQDYPASSLPEQR